MLKSKTFSKALTRKKENNDRWLLQRAVSRRFITSPQCFRMDYLPTKNIRILFTISQDIR
jgi:hypothetical protein